MINPFPGYDDPFDLGGLPHGVVEHIAGATQGPPDPAMQTDDDVEDAMRDVLAALAGNSQG